mgnify:CR=1 FL=1
MVDHTPIHESPAPHEITWKAASQSPVTLLLNGLVWLYSPNTRKHISGEEKVRAVRRATLKIVLF